MAETPPKNTSDRSWLPKTDENGVGEVRHDGLSKQRGRQCATRVSGSLRDDIRQIVFSQWVTSSLWSFSLPNSGAAINVSNYSILALFFTENHIYFPVLEDNHFHRYRMISHHTCITLKSRCWDLNPFFQLFLSNILLMLCLHEVSRGIILPTLRQVSSVALAYQSQLWPKRRGDAAGRNCRQMQNRHSCEHSCCWQRATVCPFLG